MASSGSLSSCNPYSVIADSKPCCNTWFPCNHLNFCILQKNSRQNPFLLWKTSQLRGSKLSSFTTCGFCFLQMCKRCWCGRGTGKISLQKEVWKNCFFPHPVNHEFFKTQKSNRRKESPFCSALP